MFATYTLAVVTIALITFYQTVLVAAKSLGVCVLDPVRCAKLHGLTGRPALSAGAKRQLLIVGTMGSGTTQMSTLLSRLGLEIHHEGSDPSTTECRGHHEAQTHACTSAQPEP